MPDERLTLGLAAVRVGGGVQVHHLRKLAHRNAIPVTRAGRLYLVELRHLETIRDACRAAGYFQPDLFPGPIATPKN